MTMRILLVEDEPRMADMIARGLRESSYAVDVAENGEAGLFQSSINRYDLVILDVMLPGMSGFEVCRTMRQDGKSEPILMLTARDSVDDRVVGLDCGADDYLTKPFEFKELLARLRALSRRAREVRPPTLRVSDLVLNTSDHSVSRAGRTILLTAKEYALLEFFMIRAGTVLSREAISEHVWDENFDPFSNTIDVYVRRLRRKIDEGFGTSLIQTRRGEGYILTGGPGS
jgi:two-component system copper resistance phosphate regulon response regulator CusR